MSADPDSLRLLVVAWGGALGLVFGALTQATRFCTMGALADLVSFGDATRLRMWVGATLVALLGTQALIAFGGVDLSASIYTGRRLSALSQALGGTLFGFGMVLASGCASRALVRSGSGSLKALVVLLVVAVTAQMTLRGVLAVPRTEWLDPIALDLPGPQDLPALLAPGLPGAGLARALLCAAIAAPLLWWLARDREYRRIPPLAASLGVGALVTAAWFVTGSLGFVSEHPETLEPAWLGTNSRRPEALSFVAPTAYTVDLLTLWSDRSLKLGFGVATALGTVLGSLASSLLRREFHWEGFRDARDLGTHLVGGALMGAGGVTALGCSIGQGVSGLSLLSLGSFIAVAGIAAGALAALRYQTWRIERGA